MALPYLFFPILNVLINSSLVKNIKKEYESLLKSLSNKKLQTMANDLSSKLLNKTILIYGSPELSSVAYRWKTQFNENSKMFAFNNTFSELNHNELEAYKNNKEIFCILLSKDDDHIRIKKRIKLTKETLTKNGIETTQINMSGTSKLTKMFTSLFIGDYTSLILAFKQNFDPSPVPTIDEFKNKLQ
jgi:glucose/mannose-6-phosphate isomerase